MNRRNDLIMTPTYISGVYDSKHELKVRVLVRRFLVAENLDQNKALDRLKKTFEFRMSWGTIRYRLKTYNN